MNGLAGSYESTPKPSSPSPTPQEETSSSAKERLAVKIAKKCIPYVDAEIVEKGFDAVCTHLCEKYKITDALILKESRMLECSGEEAKLRMIARVFTRLAAGVNPQELRYSPSIAEKAEQTALSPSIVLDIEQCFKKYVKYGNQEPTAHQKEQYTLFYSGTSHALIQLQEIDRGAFKVATLGRDYFAHIPQIPVAILKPFAPVGATPTVEEEDSSSEQLGSSSDEIAPASNWVDSDISQEDSTSSAEVSPYEKEIAMTWQMQKELPDAVIKLHRVVHIDTGDAMMVMEEAGYVIASTNTHEQVKVVNLSDMAKLYKEGSLTEEEKGLFMKMLDEAFHAIELMGEKGYIHRDIKEKNLLITREGRCVLSDFGTTVKEHGDIDKYVLGGTGGYTAPEAFIFAESERWDQLDRRCEVWSAGMVLQNIFIEGGILAHYALNGITNKQDLTSRFKGFEDPKSQQDYESKYPEPANKQSIEHLIWSATQLDPSKRPTMSRFREAFAVANSI